MPKISILLPASFTFRCEIPVRITDLNYGGHVGNDTVLSYLHEARTQFLISHGYTELDFAGCGLIMGDAAISFRREMFYGQRLLISVAADEAGRAAFELAYKIESGGGEQPVLLAVARTGMVCYDYTAKKVVTIPAAARRKLFGPQADDEPGNK